MHKLTITLLLANLLLAAATTSDWVQDEWDKLPKEVQNHMEDVVSQRYSLLYWDVYENCKREDTKQPQVIIHLQIINETCKTTESYDKRVLWETKHDPCVVQIFEGSDEVLRSWCTEKSDRYLVFNYNHTENSYAKADQKFKTVVKTACHYFKTQQDSIQSPITTLFGRRNEGFAPQTLLIAVLIVLIIAFTFLLCHRSPMKKALKSIGRKWEMDQMKEIIVTRETVVTDESKKELVFKMDPQPEL